MRTVVANDLAQLADAIANRFEVAADLAIAARGRFACALAGGPVAGPIHSRLVTASVEWSRVVLLQAHDRPVPLYDDEGRGISWRMLADHVVLPADDETVAEAIGPERRIDAVALTIDEDGRIAGIYPREQLQGARELWIVASGAACGRVVREALEDPRSTLPIAELTRNAADVTWFLDADAAALLSSAASEATAPPG